MELAWITKLIVLCCLIVLFGATVLVTPGIWSKNGREKRGSGNTSSPD
jgi:hypothetical protein